MDRQSGAKFIWPFSRTLGRHYYCASVHCACTDQRFMQIVTRVRLYFFAVTNQRLPWLYVLEYLFSTSFLASCGRRKHCSPDRYRTTAPGLVRLDASSENYYQPALSPPHHKHPARTIQWLSNLRDGPCATVPPLGLHPRYRPAVPYPRS